MKTVPPFGKGTLFPADDIVFPDHMVARLFQVDAEEGLSNPILFDAGAVPGHHDGRVVFQIIESPGGNFKAPDGHPGVTDGDHVSLAGADDFRLPYLHRFQGDGSVDHQVPAVFTGIDADHVSAFRHTKGLGHLCIGLPFTHFPDGGLRFFRHPHEKDRYEEQAEDDFSFHSRSPQSPSAIAAVPRIRK